MSMIDLNLDQYWEAEFSKMREELAGIRDECERVKSLVMAQPTVDHTATIEKLKTAVNTLINNAEQQRSYDQMVRNPPVPASPIRIM